MRAIALLIAAIAQTSVLGKSIFPIPDPYRWDESFTVELPRIDDEHRGLFNALLLIERENTEENLQDAIVKYRDHFKYEEGQFSQTMDKEYTKEHKKKHAKLMDRMQDWNAPVPSAELAWAKDWLVQHIKNTDFDYMGNMPHRVPNPYHWDDSFEVFYARLDDEHKQLFDAIREVANHPERTGALSDLLFKMRAHFDYEQDFFCDSDTYQDCESHKEKHETFYKKLYSFKVPVAKSHADWAKNWLVQHIKNTDFQYKHKLNTYQHDVPRPYIWDKSFEVYYKQLDDEHVGLFDAIRECVDNPDDAEKFENLKHLMKEHFDYEEAEFSKIPDFDSYAANHIQKHADFMEKLNSVSVPLDCDFVNFIQNWLAQHIKNTDFGYKSKMVHDVPEPYTWDESFMTFYKQLDDEHKGLFDCIRECGDDPNNQEKYSNCKSLLRRHFDYEESEFCKVLDYDCHGHYLKHFKFQTKFQSAKLPLDQNMISFAKNWLAQHIKNTDHAYRGKMNLRRHFTVPDPYVWDISFTVDIEQMDKEHVGLFDSIRAVEAQPEDQAVWNNLNKLFNEHFAEEENLFSQIQDQKHDIADHKQRHLGLMSTIQGTTVPVSKEMTEFIKNWLAQHIKNTDFSYKGKMPKVHPIPEPFQWDASFAVFYSEMDDEHKPLFDCLKKLESSPSDDSVLKECLENYTHHFEHEEELLSKSSLYPAEELYHHKNKHNAFLTVLKGVSTPVTQSWIDYAKNWLTQHIKNTDSRYKNMMPHPVADPYVWDESFLVNYKQLDDEHVELFKALQDLADNPNDVDILNYNRDVFRDHFDYEEAKFMACGVSCNADDHKKKHDIFFKTLTWVTNPVSKEYLEFAKNWLAQHIKNTDFLYKYKLPSAHKVPNPYDWNNDFEVFYEKLDEEHKGLFTAMREVEEDLLSQNKVDELKDLLRDHFVYEERQICDSKDIDWEYCKEHKKKHVLFSEKLAKMDAPVDEAEIKWAQNWLAQHIRNTDFGYKGKLSHPIPEPYVWDSSFATNYQKLDDEHDVLFQNILAVSQKPDDAATLENLKNLLRDHFEYEEGKFCAVPNFNCVDHKMKHYKFFVVFKQQQVPVGCEEINFAKNWLAQHIKNTDHQYKNRL